MVSVFQSRLIFKTCSLWLGLHMILTEFYQSELWGSLCGTVQLAVMLTGSVLVLMWHRARMLTWLAQMWNDTRRKRTTSFTLALNDKALIICVLQRWWAWCWWPTSMREFSLSTEKYSNQPVVVLMYSTWVLLNWAAVFSLSCFTRHPLLLLFLFCIHAVCHLLSLSTQSFLTPMSTSLVRCLELAHDRRLTQYTRSLPMGRYFKPSPRTSSLRFTCERGSTHRVVWRRRWWERRRRKRKASSTQVRSLCKFCKACRRGWVVLGDSGLTSSQLKPLAHFTEEFGDRCLNQQPFLVSAPYIIFFLPTVFFFYILILLPAPLLLIGCFHNSAFQTLWEKMWERCGHV